MAWYRTGTISLTNGSTTVTGSSTDWIANAAVGEALYAPDGKLYEIASVASNTSLTLATPYLGTTASGQTYVIVPSQSYIRDLAAQAAELVNNYSTIYNTTGQGKFVDGTVSAPGITFQQDTDTGFYRSAANEVTFVANGQAIFKYNTSGVTLTTGSLSLAGSNTLGDSGSGDTQTLNGATVINANSSSAGLRITQTGGGNALLVEDTSNPDDSPFVINTDGIALFGHTSSVSAVGGQNVNLQISGVSGATGESITRFSTDAGTGQVLLQKSRGALGLQGLVASGDPFGQVAFGGSDGTAFVEGARIRAEVDGTPGTNDMPGRIVFSTTADGASSSTERMRIDSAGSVGIGATSLVGINLRLSKNITGNTNTQAIRNDGVVQSDSTASSAGYYSQIGTAAAAFTLSNLYHQRILQGTFGAGSAVTNQYGFYSDASLTGATNNYGFYSNIASGTGRWNFYAAGTADNYFAGNVGIGATSAVAKLDVRDAAPIITANASGFSTASNGSGFGFYQSAPGRAAGYTWTIGNVTTSGGTLSTDYQTGSVVFSLRETTTSSTLTERMRIDSAGRVGIGSTSLTGYSLRVGSNITGATSAYGVFESGQVQSDVTNTISYFRSANATAAASFTANSVRSFEATQAIFGAGSVVTNQTGFFADASLTGATNNYGFYSNIASGTGRWNFYAAGSADNYFAGSVGIGATANASAILDAQSTTKGVRFPNMTTTQKNAIASPAAGLVVFDTTLAKLCVYTGAAWQTITSA